MSDIDRSKPISSREQATIYGDIVYGKYESDFIHDYLIERKFEIVENDDTAYSIRYRRFFLSAESDLDKSYSDICVSDNNVMIVETRDTPNDYDSMMIARSYIIDNLEQLKFLLNNNTNPSLSYFKEIDNVTPN